jgi:hypothetical protein
MSALRKNDPLGEFIPKRIAEFQMEVRISSAISRSKTQSALPPCGILGATRMLHRLGHFGLDFSPWGRSRVGPLPSRFAIRFCKLTTAICNCRIWAWTVGGRVVPPKDPGSIGPMHGPATETQHGVATHWQPQRLLRKKPAEALGVPTEHRPRTAATSSKMVDRFMESPASTQFAG